MNECKICKKKSEYNGLVYYTFDMPETYLCRSHYMKWCIHIKPYNDKNSNVKPNTPEWDKLCSEQSKLFMKWLKQMSNF